MVARRGLVTAGAVTLGAGYGLALIGAIIGAAVEGRESPSRVVCSESAIYGLIPLAGPIVVASQWPNHVKVSIDSPGTSSYDCRDLVAPVVALSVIDTVAQVAGAAMLVTGLVWKKPAEARGNALQRSTILVAPAVSGQFMGITLQVGGF